MSTVLNRLNSSNSEQLALKGLITKHRKNYLLHNTQMCSLRLSIVAVGKYIGWHSAQRCTVQPSSFKPEPPLAEPQF